MEAAGVERSCPIPGPRPPQPQAAWLPLNLKASGLRPSFVSPMSFVWLRMNPI
jgi:hypothetical protein